MKPLLPMTPVAYNANIGPGGPDMNKVGFPRVHANMKQKMSPFMAADQATTAPQSGTLGIAQPGMMPAQPAPMATNVVANNPQRLVSGSDVSGFKSGSFRR